MQNTRRLVIVFYWTIANIKMNKMPRLGFIVLAGGQVMLIRHHLKQGLDILRQFKRI